MRSIWIFFKDLILLLRDKQALLTMIAMPLILIGILGMAFSNLFAESDTTSDVKVASFELAVVDLDQSTYSTGITNELLDQYLNDYIDLQMMSLAEMELALAQATVEQALIIPAGFEASINSGEQAAVTLITAGTSTYPALILNSALLQYSMTNAGIEASIAVLTEHYAQQPPEAGMMTPEQSAANGQPAANAGTIAPGGQPTPSLPAVSEGTLATGGQLAPDLPAADELQQQAEQTVPLHIENVRGSAETVSSFQYYAVAMAVMFLLMTVVILVGTMIEEKNESVYDRQLTTMLQPWQYMLGKFIGLFLISNLQLLVIVAGTALLFGVNWGNSTLGLMLTMLSFTLSTSGLGVFVGSFIQKESVFTNVGMIGTQILAAIGGSFVPIYLFPEWMHIAAKVVPNALALQMFLELMSGGAAADIWQEAAIAAAVGIALMLLAWLRLMKQGGERRV